MQFVIRNGAQRSEKSHFLKRILFFFFVFVNFIGSAQQILPFDSLKIQGTKDFFADDYGSFYVSHNRDFSFTKYGSAGQQLGTVMLTRPFKIQNVQNPLNIVLFSENAQEIKFLDQNLNEIQKIDLQKFGFIKMAYAEDLQQIWLLDDSARRMIQYNFREDKIISAFPFNFSFDEVLDMIVFEENLYLLSKNSLSVINLKNDKIVAVPQENAVKLRRENNALLIISENRIQQLLQHHSMKTLFESPSAEIVDKNSHAYFEVRAGKLYLYRLEKQP